MDFFKAIANCFKGFNLIFNKGLWPFLLYPLIIWFLFWISSIWMFSSVAQYISGYISDKLQFDDIPEKGSIISFLKPFLKGYFSFIISWVLKILFWFISGTITKYIVLILLSPLFALLSESVEEKINGIKYLFNTHQFIKDIGRGILMSLINMILEYIFIGIFFIMSIIFPPLILITAPLLIVISWYFLGFTLLDYNFERHKMTINQSVKFARKHIGLTCGIGLIYSFFMLFPLFIGLMLGPVLAVVGATISFLELKQMEDQG